LNKKINPKPNVGSSNTSLLQMSRCPDRHLNLTCHLISKYYDQQQTHCQAHVRLNRSCNSIVCVHTDGALWACSDSLALPKLGLAFDAHGWQVSSRLSSKMAVHTSPHTRLASAGSPQQGGRSCKSLATACLAGCRAWRMTVRERVLCLVHHLPLVVNAVVGDVQDVPS
jgi:hypothetical protein